jgi:hypothetical protein
MSSPVNNRQQQQQEQEQKECSICMDVIEGQRNIIVTECGHMFHCSCLMQNIAHNGFDCPLCRSIMAETADDDDDDDDEDIDELDSQADYEMFDDDALTSFRMFWQQNTGEVVEEEPLEDNDDWSTEDGDEERELMSLPDSSYVTQKLLERGIVLEDLVKNILFQEFGTNKYDNYQQRSMQIYGQFRAIFAQYSHRNAQPIQQAEQTQIQT